MNYGFIGTGVITEAIITGMMRSGLPVTRIIVSPRNKDVAKRLSERFAKVEVAADNQAAADHADVLVLAVVPQIAEEVLTGLSIRPGTKIISLVAGTSHDKLSAWTRQPADTIVRAVPLPFVATGEGVTAIFPADATAEALFNAMGKAVPCATKQEYDLFAVVTALMGTYFGVLQRSAGWLSANGLAPEKTRDFLLPLFGSLAQFAKDSPDMSFGQLRDHFSTRGGLNEQVFADFEAKGGSAALTQALDRVLKRVQN